MHKINHADIKQWAKDYDGEPFDGILCDPPYELGFMGKSWDSSGIAFDTDMWADLFKLVKPGGHLLAFSGSRTYHRMAVAIEDAGFEIRDMIEWVYASGFPKALNINKQLNTCECGGNAVPYIYDSEVRQLPEGNEKEPIPTKEKQGQVLQSGVSEQSVHSSMQGQEPSQRAKEGKEPSLGGRKLHRATEGLQDDTSARTPQSEAERLRLGTHTDSGTDVGQTTRGGRGSSSSKPQEGGQPTRESKDLPRPQQPLDGESLPRCAKCKNPILRTAYKSALKPAHEPCVLARKPLEKNATLAQTMLKHGTGGLNIDGTRVEAVRPAKDRTESRGRNMDFHMTTGGNEENQGRFPANLIHDGSDEVEAVFPQTKSGSGVKKKASNSADSIFNINKIEGDYLQGDSGSASRFFYTAKASKSERNAGLEGFANNNPPYESHRANYANTKGIDNPRAGAGRGGGDNRNNHPTVKPLSLTKYLATLIKPPTGGRLLVPFSGSGSEMIGALQAGWEYVEGVELTEEYIPIAEARIKYWLEQMLEDDKQIKLI